MTTLTFEDYYANNPTAVIDQNEWTDKEAEVAFQYQTGQVVYTPLVQWMNRSQQTGAAVSEFTDLLEGDVDNDEISMTAMYIPEPLGVDSRARRLQVKRYGDKVQIHESDNIFQQWQMSGGRNWQPLMRGILGNNVVRKTELLSRNAYLMGPQSYWTYAGGATDFGDLDPVTDKFSLEAVLGWNLRLGFLGTPVIPGDTAAAKLAITAPGCIYDFRKSIAAAADNEAALWRDALLYQGSGTLRYEIGSYSNVRFIQAPTDRYGINPAVLYNCGAITAQALVTAPIDRGDGAPDPENDDPVDDVWYVGQKDVTHYITVDDPSDFLVNDMVTLHTVRTSAYGVTNGVNPLSGKNVTRRIVKIDGSNISFDRPIMKPYDTDLDSPNGTYAYLTKAVHIGFTLVLGSQGGIKVNVNQPLKFYNPRPIDDFESVWRYVWDIKAGFNIWEPTLWECHFSAVSLPKPGGVITGAEVS